MRPRLHYPAEANRIKVLAVIFLLLAGWILARLVMLQVFAHDYYSLFAQNSHEINRQLRPPRGKIYLQDTRTGREYPAAINREYYQVYANPKEIPAARAAAIAERLKTILALPLDTASSTLLARLTKPGDPYEPLARKVERATAEALQAEGLPGIYAQGQDYRFYPEEKNTAAILGFVSFTSEGQPQGNYGVEGWWQEQLAGRGGFVSGERGALGNWIILGERRLVPAEAGADLLLTIDRTLQYYTCRRLAEGFREYGAKSAAAVLLEPATGAIRALCSLPDFDPNDYGVAKDFSVFNNTAIFTPYEPGSVFKSIAMAAALDRGIVTPATVYTDPCRREINGYIINNAQNKCYGKRSMTEVLEYSINTGIVWVQEQLGREDLRHYAERFGFGQKSGIELKSEVSGTIAALNKTGAIYSAVAAFGQGITATPLQLALAYAAIANDGKLLKPYIVAEVRKASGQVIKTSSQTVTQVITPRTAKLLTEMLVAVMERLNRRARLPSYYVAVKTGTAQIPGSGGYTAETNHTVAGFAPADNPALALVVKYEAPARAWAENTSGPVFADIMKFALEYYGVPRQR